MQKSKRVRQLSSLFVTESRTDAQATQEMNNVHSRPCTDVHVRNPNILMGAIYVTHREEYGAIAFEVAE